MKIDEDLEVGYEVVKIAHVGFVNPYAQVNLANPYAFEGMLVLRSDAGKEFHMRAFSGEVARYIARFAEKMNEEVPTIYRMLEEICENCEMVLVKVKVYETGKVLRANLYLTGKRDLVLRNYRASDALALAALYNIPILIKNSLLTEKIEAYK